MIRSLEAGASIARYRVVSLLGAGGMGEVYLARDESLDRSVALKILPPDLVKNDERVRRFVQEARSASSLNHPHIVTIYEIGQADIGGADGVAETIHFIAMELVSGATLKTLIHQDKTDLKTLVRHLAQAADGLAKAHAAGIVHRDLKPENIMVTSDGFAKVVDFGLAKLTETTAGGTEVTSAPTEQVRRTGAGVVLGTVGYMSPEQVQGKTVDHRSDIFSLGCVLYEAATRQRPFQADSDVETLHKILKEKPQPIEEVNREVPADLRRVIRRCLAKAPDQRWQSMKDLALELAEIADEYDTLTASSASGTRVSSGGMGEVPTSRRTRALVAAAFIVGSLGLIAAAWSLWRTPGGDDGAGATPSALQVTPLLSSPDIETIALSPDGRQLVFMRRHADASSLWLHQLATRSDAQLLPPQEGLGFARFSADGSYVYFTAEGADGRMALHRLPAIGGTPERLRRVNNPFLGEVTLAPDGRRFAFLRIGPGEADPTQLVVANLDDDTERILVTLTSPARFRFAGLDWSPDGTMLAAMIDRQLVAIPAAGGSAVPIGAAQWSGFRAGVSDLAWLGDGSGVVVAGQLAEADESGRRPQVWLASYPDGRLTRLINDSGHYFVVTGAGDGRSLVAMQRRFASRLFVAPARDLAQAREIRGSVASDEGYSSPSASDDGVLVQRSVGSGAGSSIWFTAPDAPGGRSLTPVSLRAYVPLVSKRAGIVVFRSQVLGEPMHASRMTLEGSDLRRLPSNPGDVPVAISPDGQTVLLSRSGDRSQMQRLQMSGSAPTSFLDEDGEVSSVDYSHDGKRLLVAVHQATNRLKLTVMPADGGPALQSWEAPEGAGTLVKWSPSGDAVDFRRTFEGTANLWRQPVGGGPARRITSFTDDTFAQFDWSPDGRLFYYIRNERSATDAVLITNFRPDGKTP